MWQRDLPNATEWTTTRRLPLPSALSPSALFCISRVRATAEPLVADIARVKGEDSGKCARSVLCLSGVALLPVPSQSGPALSGMSSALNTSAKCMSQMSKATLGLYCKAQAGESDRIAVLATKSSLRIGGNPQALIYTLNYCARQLGIKPQRR
jgi:hypothetical protein